MARTTKKHVLVTDDTPVKRVQRTNAAADKKQPVTVRAAQKHEETRYATLNTPNTLNTLNTLNIPPTVVLDVLMFGDGEAGELGLGPDVTSANNPKHPYLSATTTSTTMAPYETVQVACGGMHSVALTRDNQIAIWGVNDHGALGRDTAWDGGRKDIKDARDGGGDSDSNSGSAAMLNPHESNLTAIPAGTRFVQVDAGDSCSFANHALALERVDKKTKYQTQKRHQTRLWAWGCGGQHQLGRRLVERHCPRDRQGKALLGSRVPRVVEFRHADHFAFVASGECHAFAVSSSGRVWAWSLNSFSETGAAPEELQRHGADAEPTVRVPTEVAALANQSVVALAGGGHHSVSLCADGRCLAWGLVDSGQLGMDLKVAEEDRLLSDERGRPHACLVPTEVDMDHKSKAVAVACGTEHTLVVTLDDGQADVFGTGFNGQTQLGLGPDADDDVAAFTRTGGKDLQDRPLSWAGAGGQFSMVAGPRRISPLV